MSHKGPRTHYPQRCTVKVVEIERNIEDTTAPRVSPNEMNWLKQIGMPLKQP